MKTLAELTTITGFKSAAIDAPRCVTCGGTGTVEVLDREPAANGYRYSHVEACPTCGTHCETCGGIGVIKYSVGVSDPRFGQLFLCPRGCKAAQQMQMVRRDGLRKYSKLPAEYADLTFATFDALPELMRAGKMPARWSAEMFVNARDAQYYVNRADVARYYGHDDPDDWRNWLVLWGAHGRGKTGLAAAIVNGLTEADVAVLYIRLQDFIEAVQKRYDRERRKLEGFDDEFGQTADSVQDSVKNAPVLVIDEFDLPQISENKRDIVERIIRYRHGERLPTVITTNLSPKTLEQRWGPTIASVIRGRAHWIEMVGPSLRPVENLWAWDR